MKLRSTHLLLIALTFFTNITLFGQEADSIKYTSSHKGKLFISWGGNRAYFTKSDITFKGENYRFTLDDVESHDKPKGWHIDYINPSRITIPQTNMKISYFINDNYYVAIALDHMKYVMTQDQFVTINGNINLPASEPGSVFNGNYQNETIQTTVDFLMFEHTNGLNYVYAEFGRLDDISKVFGINNTDVFQVNITEGVGAGILYPKTNTYLLQKPRYDEFHLAGYGISATAGLNLTFFKHFFIQGDLRGGFIDMNDIRTTINTNGRASQHFFYMQTVFSIGGIIKI